MCGSKSPEELGHFRRDCRPGSVRRTTMVVLKVRENHGFGLRFGGRKAPSYAGDFARPQLVDSRDTLTARVRQTWH